MPDNWWTFDGSRASEESIFYANNLKNYITNAYIEYDRLPWVMGELTKVIDKIKALKDTAKEDFEKAGFGGMQLITKA